MKRHLLRSGLIIALLAAFAGGAFAIGLGDPMPMTDVQMKNVDGGMVSIGEVRDEAGTLVIFTCNSCPYAKAWEERIAELGNAYQAKGIGVIAINSNDPEVVAADGFDEMVARAKTLGLEFPYVVDGTSDVARAYGATKTPEVFLFDAEGRLAYHGAVDDNVKDPEAVEHTYLKDALEAVLKGGAVDEAETKALGCSIKFRS